MYLHCPRCRLAINCRAAYLTLTNCPRCLARAAIASPLFMSGLNASELHATTRSADDRRLPSSHPR
jgi:tRNA G26 N,N-dimethylase Trm1